MEAIQVDTIARQNTKMVALSRLVGSFTSIRTMTISFLTAQTESQETNQMNVTLNTHRTISFRFPAELCTQKSKLLILQNGQKTQSIMYLLKILY